MSFRFNRPARLGGAIMSLCLLAMLVATSGCSSMKYGEVAAIQPVSQSPRVGNAYLIRGLIGLFSAGIDGLTVKVNEAGIHAEVFQEVQDADIAKAIIARYRTAPAVDREPLCLIGHSVGAEDVITIARKLDREGIEVDLMITLDATNPTTVPKNVKRCVNYYQPSMMDYLPVLRGLALRADDDFAGELVNLDVRGERRDLLEWDTNHFNIDKNSRIHGDILERLRDVCVPREQWAAMKSRLARDATAAPAAPQ